MYILSCKPNYQLFFSSCFAFSPFPVFFCRAGGQTAWDMLNEERFSSFITTSCLDLDNNLGGRLNCKEVTEIGESVSFEHNHNTNRI